MNSDCCPEGRWISTPSHRGLFAPDLSEMLKSPLCDLLWGDIEHEAVREAVIRAEARIRDLQARVERRASREDAAASQAAHPSPVYAAA